MPEKKQPEKIKPLPELKTAVTEILVANGRSIQPFIRTLHATEENVARSSLGTLIGVFEIDDQSEDSAYIVNFLASVAKKEFFNNPRRGAIESFEAALHKINLALAELVKHGNVAWLGKLHGAIGVLEKNNLHFSVTGHASILLLRNDTLADISQGLASEESHLHPIKTFVEVSSGRLSVDDQVLLCSPELLALFSLPDLCKTAGRMDHERFTQFLKTALVNELDMASLVIVNVEKESIPTETKVPPQNREGGGATPIANVFSQSAFKERGSKAQLSVAEVLAKEKQERDYVDTKTGHIYVQGTPPQAPSDHPAFDAWRLAFQDVLHSTGTFLTAQSRRVSRASSKQFTLLGSTLREAANSFTRKLVRGMRRSWKKYQTDRAEIRKRKEETAERASKPAALPPITPAPVIRQPKKPAPVSHPVTATQEITQKENQPETTEGVSEELPDFIKEKLANFYRREQAKERADLQKAPEQISFGNVISLLRGAGSFAHDWSMRVVVSFRRVSLRRKLRLMEKIPKPLIAFFTVLLGGIALTFFLTSSPSQPSSEQGTPAEIPSSSEEATTPVTSRTVVLLPNTEIPITNTLILNDESYVITEKDIISLNEGKHSPLPGGNKARLSAAMDDLGLLFILTESGKLYAWSPLNKSFVENTLTLPEGAKVEALGAYLTYLYVLDSATNQIYRFPRAEGGFGAGTPWLKENVTLETDTRMAVNETIFLSPDPGTVRGFFHGRATSTLAAPDSGLHLTALYTHPRLQNVYALDTEHQSIYEWSPEGTLLNTYPDPAFSQGVTFSVNEKRDELFIGTTDTLLSYKLK